MRLQGCHGCLDISKWIRLAPAEALGPVAGAAVRGWTDGSTSTKVVGSTLEG